MKRCLDEGFLQSYLDGELSHEQTCEAATHIAACDSCAAALAAIEQENSFFSNAFAPDDSVSVPSEALRSRITAAVAQHESRTEENGARSRGRNFGGLFASLSSLFTFTPQSAAAFAGLLAVVAFAVIYFAVERQRQTPTKTQDTREVASLNPMPERSPEVMTTPSVTFPVSAPTSEKGSAGPRYLKAYYDARRHSNRSVGVRQPLAPVGAKDESLPGEKDYQTAIASLEKTIKLGGDVSLRPSVRVAYERNLALLDSAINQTRSVAAQNPKDKDAVGFLMAAYQSKVELLTKVADQAQVATLGR
ncbi:MAG: hypothetical protein QOH51_1587 [Acidobacteriota bacterium]|jgi:hypothetical protein|nr:hypothetical protein [Acidobacteriota bacterium]